jgi:hypothetical protein
MTPSVILIGGADAAFYERLAGMLASVREHASPSTLALGVLDLGLSGEQRRELAALGASLANPGWDFPVPGHLRQHGYLRAMTARPHLPRYFPGFDLYVWLDADAWVQQPHAISTVVSAAYAHGCVLVPELDRAYANTFAEHPISDHHLATYVRLFGSDNAWKLSRRPILNSGVFAARADSPVWGAWAEACKLTMGDRFVHLSEQAALTVAIYGNAVPVHYLPSRYNWICSLALPLWDDERRRLVDPCMPHDVLEIVHATGGAGGRQSIRTSAGHVLDAELTYGTFAPMMAA